MNQTGYKTNDEKIERFIWSKLIQPIIDAYKLNGIEYQHIPCVFNRADYIKMERSTVQVANRRPFENFDELFLKWTNGSPGSGKFSYKNFFIEFMSHLKNESSLPYFLEFLRRNYFSRLFPGGLTDYEIKEIIQDARADGFIWDLQLAEVLAADSQYKAILPKLWKKFELGLRGPEEPDPSTYEKRVPIWHQLLLRWTTGNIQGAPGGREHTHLNTFKPGAIELQTLKDFFERWKIPLPANLFLSEATPPQKRPSRFVNHTSPIETGAGIKWNDVEITFISDDEVLVRYAKESFSRSFKNAGFEDGRSGKPIASWAVLREAATKRGEIPFSFENRKTVEKTVQTLNAKLSILFPNIPGRPIKIYKREKRYCFEFKIASTI